MYLTAFILALLGAQPIILPNTSILFERGESVGPRSWGKVIRALGDVNGDDVADIALVEQNQILVFFGGPGADSEPDLSISLPEGGYPLTGPFDLNGDLEPDLIVAVPNATVGTMTNAGAVYCYWGGPSLDSISDAVIEGPWTDYYFGAGACRAGRFIPGDDTDDLAVSLSTAIGWGPPPTVYVYEGGSPPATESAWGRTESLHYTSWEYGFQYAGDIDGDGYGDLATGAPWANAWCPTSGGIGYECLETGRLFLYHGGPDRLRIASMIDGDEEGGHLGKIVAADLDLNSDGYADVLATEESSDQTWVILGRSDWPFSQRYPDLTLPGGVSTAALGDVNGDTYDDAVTLTSEGVMWLFFGGPGFSGLPSGRFELPAEDTGDLVGLARCDDFNADGVDDVAITIRESTSYDRWNQIYRIYSARALIPVSTERSTVGSLKFRFRSSVPDTIASQERKIR